MATLAPFTLHPADGTELAARWYRPRSRPARAVVLVAGATAVPQAFYRSWADDLADRGYDVLTLDYRGIGESRRADLRGFAATMQDWGRLDLQAALDRAADEAGERPLLLVGHSFGGQALGLVEGGERIAGGLTVGAQLGWYGHWPVRERIRLASLWFAVVPAMVGWYGYLPGWAGVGEDLPGGVAKEWARWCRSPRYLVDHVPDAARRFERLRAPLDVIAVSDDDYAPEPAVRAYAALLPSAEVHRWTPSDGGVERLGHFGFFRPAASKLWDRAAALLEAHLPLEVRVARSS